MAKNEIFRNAQHLGLPVDSAVKSGDIVTFINIGGVAQTDYDARDGKATIWFDGGYEFGPYTGFSVGNAAYAIGDAIYAHAVGGGAPVAGAKVGLIDKTSTTGVLIGHAIEAKTTTGGTGTLRVRLATS